MAANPPAPSKAYYCTFLALLVLEQLDETLYTCASTGM